MIAGICTVIPTLDVIAATCIAIIIIMAAMIVGLRLMVPKYSTCAMVLKIISTLAYISKHWSPEYFVQEISSQNYVIASGGDCKI
jgi:hypothetical protein